MKSFFNATKTMLQYGQRLLAVIEYIVYDFRNPFKRSFARDTQTTSKS